jgi:hypothetical protein
MLPETMRAERVFGFWVRPFTTFSTLQAQPDRRRLVLFEESFTIPQAAIKSDAEINMEAAHSRGNGRTCCPRANLPRPIRF